ncbi:MAG: hypothetical protein E6H45_11445 [Betaproteobacteria bacterium]|nr:MAG: hypothetical protein E6H45_11445 [Betaproteobacteria bacterium]
MRRAFLWIVDHSALAATLVALLTLALAAQLPKLEIDASAEGLMVANDPAREYYEDAKRKFGSDTVTIVLVKAEDVFTPAVLGAVRRLSDAFERIEGVRRVDSLTTVRNLSGRGDFLDTDLLVAPEIPTAPADLGRIRDDALRHRVIAGNLVAATGRATAIYVFTDLGLLDREFNKRLTDRVEALIRQEAAPGLTIHQIGGPITKVTFGEFMQRDLVGLIPIALAVVAVLLLLLSRSVQGVVVPIVTSLVSVVWALGLMALVGLPVNVATAMIPALLITIGFPEDIHLIAEYQLLLREGHDRRSALRTAVSHLAQPITITTTTTVVGFGSLITTDITMLIQFGYAAAMALTANFVVTMGLAPALLAVWPVPGRSGVVTPQDERSVGGLPEFMARLGESLIRHRGAIVLIFLAISLASLVGWANLRVNTDFLSYFPEDAFIRKRVADFQQSLGGGDSFYVVVDTGRAGGAKEPAVLRTVAQLQDFLTATAKIDKTVSLADFLKTMHREMNGGDPGFEVIPPTRDPLDPALAIRVTGESVLIHNAADVMAINEVTSFIFTFIVIGLIHAWLFRSVIAAVLTLIPNLIPILVGFGLMGALGVPLNTGTAMVATIAIGIAVDDTVHFVDAFRRHFAQGGDARTAVLLTLRSQGRPIIYVSLTLAAGFLVMTASNFLPVRSFGIFSALVMLVAMVAELALTPILLYSIPRARSRASV